MHDSTSILNILLRSIFVGFGFVIPIVAFLKTSDLTKLKFKDLFVLTAVQAVRIAGIIYFLLFAVEMIGMSYSDNNMKFNYLAPHWLYYWYPALMYLLLTQLFWIKKFYINKKALITFSVLLLLLPSQKVIALLLSFQNTYLPASWTMFTADPQLVFNPVIEFVLNIIVFIFIIFTIMLAGNKFKQIKQ